MGYQELAKEKDDVAVALWEHEQGEEGTGRSSFNAAGDNKESSIGD